VLRLITVIWIAVVIATSSIVGAQASPSIDPEAVDAKIVVVWPHDSQGRVASATHVNVRVYLFERGTLKPVPCDFEAPVRLWTDTVGSAAHPAFLPPTKSVMTIDGKTFPVWEFNDIGVSSTVVPNPPIHMFIDIEGMRARTNIWTHAIDPRTINPTPQVYPPIGVTAFPSADGVITVVWPHDRDRPTGSC